MEEKYAYLTIQRYVLLLIHSYDFLIPELLTIMEIHQKRSLKERLLIKTFFILVFQYRETRNIFILNKKVCCIFVLRLYLFDYMHVEENTFVFI